LVVFGGADDLAPANIFSLCIETVTVTLGAPVVVQLQPVFAIGEPAPMLAPTTALTWFCVSRLHGADSLFATSGQQSDTTNTLERTNADFRVLIELSYRAKRTSPCSGMASFRVWMLSRNCSFRSYRAGAPHGNKLVGICIITRKRLSRTLLPISRLITGDPGSQALGRITRYPETCQPPKPRVPLPSNPHLL
jgi:hypothetical protein